MAKQFWLRPSPSPVRVWSDGVQALYVTFPPSKALFRNSRGGLVVKGCSSTFLSFLFSSEQTLKYSESQSSCLTLCLDCRALNIYRSLRIPSLKFRWDAIFTWLPFEDLLAVVNTLEDNFFDYNSNTF